MRHPIYAEILSKAKGFGQGQTMSEEEAAGEEETEKASSVPAADMAEKGTTPAVETEVTKSLDQIAAEMVLRAEAGPDGTHLGKAMGTPGEPLGEANIGHRTLSVGAPSASDNQQFRGSFTGMPSVDAGKETKLNPEDKPLGEGEIEGASGSGDLGQDKKLNKGYVVNGMVYVGGGLDEYITKNTRNDGTLDPEPTLALSGTMMTKSLGCGRCGTRHMAMLSVCPSCGNDHMGTPQVGPSMSISKSVANSLVRRGFAESFYPNGEFPLE